MSSEDPSLGAGDEQDSPRTPLSRLKQWLSFPRWLGELATLLAIAGFVGGLVFWVVDAHHDLRDDFEKGLRRQDAKLKHVSDQVRDYLKEEQGHLDDYNLDVLNAICTVGGASLEYGATSCSVNGVVLFLGPPLSEEDLEVPALED